MRIRSWSATRQNVYHNQFANVKTLQLVYLMRRSCLGGPVYYNSGGVLSAQSLHTFLNINAKNRTVHASVYMSMMLQLEQPHVCLKTCLPCLSTPLDLHWNDYGGVLGLSFCWKNDCLYEVRQACPLDSDMHTPAYMRFFGESISRLTKDNVGAGDWIDGRSHLEIHLNHSGFACVVILGRKWWNANFPCDLLVSSTKYY